MFSASLPVIFRSFPCKWIRLILLFFLGYHFWLGWSVGTNLSKLLTSSGRMQLSGRHALWTSTFNYTRYLYVYIHTHIHTYIHTYIHMRWICNAWTNFRREFPTPKQGKKVYINACPQTLSFRCTAQQLVDLSPLYFYSWGHLKGPNIFCSIWKWSDTSPTHFWRLSNHSQPPRDIWKCATVRYQTFTCVHWFRCRKFEHLWIVTW